MSAQPFEFPLATAPDLMTSQRHVGCAINDILVEGANGLMAIHNEFSQRIQNDMQDSARKVAAAKTPMEWLLALITPVSIGSPLISDWQCYWLGSMAYVRNTADRLAGLAMQANYLRLDRDTSG